MGLPASHRQVNVRRRLTRLPHNAVIADGIETPLIGIILELSIRCEESTQFVRDLAILAMGNHESWWFYLSPPPRRLAKASLLVSSCHPLKKPIERCDILARYQTVEFNAVRIA